MSVKSDAAKLDDKITMVMIVGILVLAGLYVLVLYVKHTIDNNHQTGTGNKVVLCSLAQKQHDTDPLVLAYCK